MQQRLSNPRQVGVILSARRKAMRMPQAELAGVLGLSQNRVSELEARPESISLDRLLMMVNALGLELVIRDRPAPADTPASEW